MRWKRMKMKMMYLKVNYKWCEDIGKGIWKVQRFPNVLSDLQIVKYLPETQENQAYDAI
jgi:hypothetical protein